MREVEAAFKAGTPGPEADEKWPFDVVEQALSVASSAYYDYPKRPNPRWPVTLAYAVATYRNEVAKLRAAANWRTAQMAREQAERAGRAYEDDD